MSDARDAVAEAVALNRKLAASLLVKKEELEAELAGGPPAERAALAAADLADVTARYRSALAEIAELLELADRARSNTARQEVAEALARDPVATSYEERALDAARQYILELDAQARLGADTSADLEEPRATPAGEPAPADEPAPAPGPKPRPKKTL